VHRHAARLVLIVASFMKASLHDMHQFVTAGPKCIRCLFIRTPHLIPETIEKTVCLRSVPAITSFFINFSQARIDHGNLDFVASPVLLWYVATSRCEDQQHDCQAVISKYLVHASEVMQKEDHLLGTGNAKVSHSI
jgi:hypothetical protein